MLMLEVKAYDVGEKQRVMERAKGVLKTLIQKMMFI